MDYYFNLESILAVFGGFLIIFVLIVLAFAIVSIVASWKLFKKAGRNGWESIIPIYSTWVLNEIAGLNWWWFILLILNVTFSFENEGITYAFSICSFIASFNCYYNIARKFGKDKGISILAGIFPFIFLLVFGFSKSETYDRNIVVGKNGIFSNVDNMNNVNNTYDNSYNVNKNRDDQSTGNVDMSNVTDSNVDQSTESVDTNNTNNNNDNTVVSKKAFCGNCGNKLDDNAKFCGNCGKEI